MRCALISIVAAAGVLSGCESSSTVESEAVALSAINTHCPMMSDAEIDPTVEMASHGGHAIGFCCDPCRDNWNRLSERDRDAYVNAQLAH